MAETEKWEQIIDLTVEGKTVAEVAAATGLAECAVLTIVSSPMTKKHLREKALAEGGPPKVGNTVQETLENGAEDAADALVGLLNGGEKVSANVVRQAALDVLELTGHSKTKKVEHTFELPQRDLEAITAAMKEIQQKRLPGGEVIIDAEILEIGDSK